MAPKNKLLQFGSSLLTLTAAILVALTTAAQEINGTPGSPSATEVIKGNQLPPPPLPFGGVIKDDAKDSKPYWPPTVVPRKGAPNVLLIMTDDQGYGVIGHLWRRHPDADDGPPREGRTCATRSSTPQHSARRRVRR